MSGSIEVITGCMFSGKTEELLRRLERAEIAGQDVKVFKPDIDDRYGETEIGSHNGRKRKADILEVEKSLEQQIKELEHKIVAFDEANFFQEDLVDAVQRLSNQGKRVIVAGLDQTFRAEPFRPMPDLLALAEEVEKLKAVCVECGEEATKTQRLIDGEPAHKDDPTIVVGADEKYEARCRKCHELKTD